MKKYLMLPLVMLLFLFNVLFNVLFNDSLNVTVFAAEPPAVTATSVVLMEAKSGKIIFSKGENEKIYPASMTKILTALVALEYLEQGDYITVGSEVNDIPLDSSKAGLKRGETLSTETLMRALLIPSGNDTANVTAAAVVRKIKGDDMLAYSECEKIFADLMNEKAKELGAINSNFINPHGYHDENHYSTAHDIAVISRVAMANPLIMEVSGERMFSGPGAEKPKDDDGTLIIKDYIWRSHNLLITDNPEYYEYATGIKTGFTDEAGECVAASARKDDVDLIAVVCNSETDKRWEEARNLFDYGFDNFAVVDLHKAGDVIESTPLAKHNRLNGDTVDLIVKQDMVEYLEKEKADKLVQTTEYSDEFIQKSKDGTTVTLKAPIPKDTAVGKVKFILDGEAISLESPIYTATEVEKSTFFNSIEYYAKKAVSTLLTPKGILITLGVVIVIAAILIAVKVVIEKRKRRRFKYTFRRKKPWWRR